MPKHQQSLPLSGITSNQALAIGYQAIKNLQWNIMYAGENMLQAYTPKTLSSKGQQILLTVEGDILSISSEMVNDELLDLSGRNKKNTAALAAAFEAAKASTSPETLSGNLQAIEELKIATQEAAAAQLRHADEIDKAMNLSDSNLYVTYAIIAINVIIFILMAVNGAGLIVAEGTEHIRWGSNFSPLTLSGDWWRLVTNIFIHFGIIHLAMNMYCLYTVGVYLEPMLGKLKYTTAYLCTGVLASVVSLWWHSDGVNSAGASGAIFGLYGLFLALLTTNLIPKQVRQPLLQSIGIFVVYNLVYGMKSGVDNSAHIGGLLSGFIIGYLYAIGIKKEKEGVAMNWLIPAVIIITMAAAGSFLSSNAETPEKRNAALAELKELGYKDGDKFNDKIQALSNLEDKALQFYRDSLTEEQLQVKLKEEAIPIWELAENLGKEMQKLDVSVEMHKKADAVVEYMSLRKRETELVVGILGKKADSNEAQLDSVRSKIDEVKERLK